MVTSSTRVPVVRSIRRTRTSQGFKTDVKFANSSQNFSTLQAGQNQSVQSLNDTQRAKTFTPGETFTGKDGQRNLVILVENADGSIEQSAVAIESASGKSRLSQQERNRLVTTSQSLRERFQNQQNSSSQPGLQQPSSVQSTSVQTPVQQTSASQTQQQALKPTISPLQKGRSSISPNLSTSSLLLNLPNRKRTPNFKNQEIKQKTDGRVLNRQDNSPLFRGNTPVEKAITKENVKGFTKGAADLLISPIRGAAKTQEFLLPREEGATLLEAFFTKETLSKLPTVPKKKITSKTELFSDPDVQAFGIVAGLAGLGEIAALGGISQKAITIGPKIIRGQTLGTLARKTLAAGTAGLGAFEFFKAETPEQFGKASATIGLGGLLAKGPKRQITAGPISSQAETQFLRRFDPITSLARRSIRKSPLDIPDPIFTKAEVFSSPEKINPRIFEPLRPKAGQAFENLVRSDSKAVFFGGGERDIDIAFRGGLTQTFEFGQKGAAVIEQTGLKPTAARLTETPFGRKITIRGPIQNTREPQPFELPKGTKIPEGKTKGDVAFELFREQDEFFNFKTFLKEKLEPEPKFKQSEPLLVDIAPFDKVERAFSIQSPLFKGSKGAIGETPLGLKRQRPESLVIGKIEAISRDLGKAPKDIPTIRKITSDIIQISESSPQSIFERASIRRAKQALKPFENINAKTSPTKVLETSLKSPRIESRPEALIKSVFERVSGKEVPFPESPRLSPKNFKNLGKRSSSRRGNIKQSNIIGTIKAPTGFGISPIANVPTNKQVISKIAPGIPSSPKTPLTPSFPKSPTSPVSPSVIKDLFTSQPRKSPLKKSILESVPKRPSLIPSITPSTTRIAPPRPVSFGFPGVLGFPGFPSAKPKVPKVRKPVRKFQPSLAAIFDITQGKKFKSSTLLTGFEIRAVGSKKNVLPF